MHPPAANESDRKNEHTPHQHPWWMHLICVLPLLLLLLLGFAGMAMPGWIIWLILLLCFMAMFVFMSGHSGHEARHEQAGQSVPIADEPAQLDIEIDDVIQPTATRRFGKVVVIEGRLWDDPQAAYDLLKQRFAGTDKTALLQEGEAGQPAVVVVPRAAFQPRGGDRSVWINIGLFVATVVTTTWAGALHQGVNLLEEPGRFAVGLPYSLALMVILGAHELGHYFAARAHGMKVTWPFFIPVPFALGTFGAFIQLKSPSETRRALFDVGVAGPLAGLVFAVPALLIGLSLSQVQVGSDQAQAMHHGASVASSTLLMAMAKITLGEALTQGHVVILHPLAFAGWLGLIVTALNLLPIGQLDGGHIADAMFGPRVSAGIGTAALMGLFFMGIFVWSGLLFWAIIVYFIAGRKGLPPLNNLTPLNPARLAVGWFAFIVLLLIVVPVPHTFFRDLGIHCPYL